EHEGAELAGLGLARKLDDDEHHVENEAAYAEGQPPLSDLLLSETKHIKPFPAPRDRGRHARWHGPALAPRESNQTSGCPAPAGTATSRSRPTGSGKRGWR